MALLITGATGKSSVPLLKTLRSSYPSFEVVAASRGGKDVEGFPGAQFDWTDPSTFENPFKVNPNIQRLHILGPHTFDLLGATKPFLEFAKSKGVKRFTLLSGTPVKKGEPPHGILQQWIEEQGVEFAVIRSSKFDDEFLIEYRVSFLRDESKIVNAAGGGRAAWVDTQDIAKVTAKALTEDKPHNGEYIIVGPEILSYDQIGAIFSEVLGRPIIVDTKSGEELAQAIIDKGIYPPELAQIAPGIESLMAQGLDQSKIEGEKKIIGRISFKEFVEKNKAAWIGE